MTKSSIIAAIGIAGSFISELFGGRNPILTTLIIFMAIDYVTGLVVAGVFKSSPKTKGGTLESRAGLKGLLRKGMMLAVVLVAFRLDVVIGSEFIGCATIIAFIANETISIIENSALMGVPMPSAIKNAIEILQSKSESGGDNDDRVE